MVIYVIVSIFFWKKEWNDSEDEDDNSCICTCLLSIWQFIMFCLNAAAMGLCIAYFVILYGNGKDEVNNHYKIIDNCLDVESQKILTNL